MRATVIATFVATAVALSGCATGKKMAQTESGRPEATIQNASIEDVQGEIFSLCNRRAAAIRSSSANEVVCAKPMEGGSAIMTQLLIGNSYSTAPVVVARFSIWRAGNDVRVSAYQWAETQMAFGQMRTVELNSPEAFNSLQRHLNEISQRLSKSPAPSQPSASSASTAALAPSALSRDQWKTQQLDQLNRETGLSYEEYQRRYREIVGK